MSVGSGNLESTSRYSRFNGGEEVSRETILLLLLLLLAVPLLPSLLFAFGHGWIPPPFPTSSGVEARDTKNCCVRCCQASTDSSGAEAYPKPGRSTKNSFD